MCYDPGYPTAFVVCDCAVLRTLLVFLTRNRMSGLIVYPPCPLWCAYTMTTREVSRKPSSPTLSWLVICIKTLPAATSLKTWPTKSCLVGNPNAIPGDNRGFEAAFSSSHYCSVLQVAKSRFRTVLKLCKHTSNALSTPTWNRLSSTRSCSSTHTSPRSAAAI